MKKIIFVITIAIAAVCSFTGCAKEEESKSQISSTYSSYDGKLFYLDENFVNPYNDIGDFHNQLVTNLSTIWDDYSINNMLNEELLDYAISETQKITGVHLSTLNFNEGLFKESVIEPISKENSDKSYLEMFRDVFSSLDNLYLSDILNDVELFAYGDLSFNDKLRLIQIIEQKVFNTVFNSENTKNYYLLFCAVAKYSLINIENIRQNPSSGFYVFINNIYDSKGKLAGHGDAVMADAVGAVKGGIEGATAGAAGGPAGSVLLGAVGAVCVGGLSTAVEVGIKSNIVHWLNQHL